LISKEAVTAISDGRACKKYFFGNIDTITGACLYKQAKQSQINEFQAS
jgi:hypothetical protein